MWQEDDPSGQFYKGGEPPDEQTGEPDLTAGDEPDHQPDQGQFPGNLVPPTAFPNVVLVMDLYEAARSRAVADQQISKLFNPEYYI